MHLTSWQVYLWLKLDNLNLLFGFAACFCFLYALAVLLLASGTADHWEEFLDLARKLRFKLAVLFSVLFFVLYIFLPSTKQFALIYILPKVANSKTVHALLTEGDDTGKLLIQYAKQELEKELRETLGANNYKKE